jgi:hypothetical protein
VLNGDFEFGFPGAEQTTWCVRRVGAEATLCGRRVRASNGVDGFFPAVQPQTLTSVCWACRALYAEAEVERLEDVLRRVRWLTAGPDGLLERRGSERVRVSEIRAALEGDGHD